ncbi:hypothetical protein GCM10009104_18140 [Marinobacterium maritimum]|uniref:Uncharacterized protein n=1 Tax=Marinobacterium maritimum TaxID=500162 RepID=A0ABN1I674_9GAMM
MHIDHQPSVGIGHSKRHSLLARFFNVSLWDLIGCALACILAGYLLALHLGLSGTFEKPDKTELIEDRKGLQALPGSASGPGSQPASEGLDQQAYQQITRLQNQKIGESPEQLLNRLASYQGLSLWGISDLEVSRFQDDLDRLRALGVSALPAISAYLMDSSDVDFNSMGLASRFGYPTLRLALFSVLHDLGGNQVENILYRELKVTQKPHEIEVIGRFLEDYSPGLYASEILRSARESFDYTKKNGNSDVDLGPLFQVFSQYGDARMADDLEDISQLRWGKYGALTLSNLPDGTGLPVLGRWVYQEPKGNVSSEFSLLVLAQSSEYPVAQEILVDSVSDGLIPDSKWAQISQLIEGKYHFQFEPPDEGLISAIRSNTSYYITSSTKYTAKTPGGGQIVYGIRTGSSTLSSEQIRLRLDLVDVLRTKVESDIGREELNRAYQTLIQLERKGDR